MDPISVAIEIELASILIAAVGAAFTWVHQRNHKVNHDQRERHHRDNVVLHGKHLREMRVQNAKKIEIPVSESLVEVDTLHE